MQKISVESSGTAGAGGGKGFKKGGFKSAFVSVKVPQKVGGAEVGAGEEGVGKGRREADGGVEAGREGGDGDVKMVEASEEAVDEEEEEDWVDGPETYDPKQPTGCGESCPCRRGGGHMAR